MKTFIASVIILCAAGLTGCSTFNSRAQEKSATYDTLTPQTQQRLEKGKISIGDTQDMVFIALDTPDAKREITTANGPENVWVYKTYWEDYADTGWVGWHRYYESPRGDAYSIYHEQVPLALSRTRVADVIRVTFKDGKVISVDQAATCSRFITGGASEAGELASEAQHMDGRVSAQSPRFTKLNLVSKITRRPPRMFPFLTPHWTSSDANWPIRQFFPLGSAASVDRVGEGELVRVERIML